MHHTTITHIGKLCHRLSGKAKVNCGKVELLPQYLSARYHSALDFWI